MSCPGDPAAEAGGEAEILGPGGLPEAAGRGRVLVGFGAGWAAPWRLLAPALARLEGEGVAVVRVDCDHQPEVAETWRVVSLPTFVLLDDGSETRRWVGAVSGSALSAATCAEAPGRSSRMRRRH